MCKRNLRISDLGNDREAHTLEKYDIFGEAMNAETVVIRSPAKVKFCSL